MHCVTLLGVLIGASNVNVKWGESEVGGVRDCPLSTRSIGQVATYAMHDCWAGKYPQAIG